MTEQTGLEIQSFSIAFDNGEKVAVSDVSLNVQTRMAVGLVGESGSGKSLTSRAALGLIPNNAKVSGHIRLDGQSVLEMSPKDLQRVRGAGVAMVFQDPMSSLNPVIRVGHSIAQVVRSHENVTREDAKSRAISMMERVGIRDASFRANSFPHEFSGGMRQRIMIAMALASKPRMLVADEPTTALDVIVQKDILTLLDGLRRDEGMGLILVSHDLAVVASMCDRIAVMYAGQIVEEGPTEQVLARPRMPYTIGLLASTRRDKAVRRLTSIPGSPPPLGARLNSCRFAPRCPLATDTCRSAPVELVDAGSGHKARCIRIQDVQNMSAKSFDQLAQESAHG